MTEEEEKEEELWDRIKKNQRKQAEEWVEEKMKGLDDRKRRKAEEAWRYLKRNWKGIRARLEEEEGNIGSSTEGHVSQVLSARMSSRPMGWSRRGADQLARLRIYWKNGGKMEELLRERKEDEGRLEEEPRCF